MGEALQSQNTFDIVGLAKRQTARENKNRIAKAVTGLALLGLGLPRSTGVLRSLFVLSGGALVLSSLTGRSLRSFAAEASRTLRELQAGVARDQVDEASLQSFPASDPPAFSPQRS